MKISISPHPGVRPGVGKALVSALPSTPNDRKDLSETMMLERCCAFLINLLDRMKENRMLPSTGIQERGPTCLYSIPQIRFGKAPRLKLGPYQFIVVVVAWYAPPAGDIDGLVHPASADGTNGEKHAHSRY